MDITKVLLITVRKQALGKYGRISSIRKFLSQISILTASQTYIFSHVPSYFIRVVHLEFKEALKVEEFIRAFRHFQLVEVCELLLFRTTLRHLPRGGGT